MNTHRQAIIKTNTLFWIEMRKFQNFMFKFGNFRFLIMLLEMTCVYKPLSYCYGLYKIVATPCYKQTPPAMREFSVWCWRKCWNEPVYSMQKGMYCCQGHLCLQGAICVLPCVASCMAAHHRLALLTSSHFNSKEFIIR